MENGASMIVEDKKQNGFATWKPLLFGLSLPVVMRILEHWLSEPVASGLGLFVWFMLFYWTPPRIRGVTLIKSLQWSALGALTMYVLTKLTAGM
jgi:hypothetical protein